MNERKPTLSMGLHWNGAYLNNYVTVKREGELIENLVKLVIAEIFPHLHILGDLSSRN